MTEEEVKEKIEAHQHYLKKDVEGWENMRADFSEANLEGMVLCEVNLSDANFKGANLRNAQLVSTSLREANFAYANLENADLSRSDLRKADLTEARLDNANLTLAEFGQACLKDAILVDANLCSADFTETIFSNTRLRGANLNRANFERIKNRQGNIVNEEFRKGIILSKPMIGWKMCSKNRIVKLKIPAGAIVFCIDGLKCRTNKAKVLDIFGGTLAYSMYDHEFSYEVGKSYEIKDFNLMYNIECGAGIHFFKTRTEAEAY